MCFTWLAVGFLEGIQPIEAENLLPVWPLHQREFAGVDLYLCWSLSSSTLLPLLSPRTPDPAGPGKGKEWGKMLTVNLRAQLYNVCSPFYDWARKKYTFSFKK